MRSPYIAIRINCCNTVNILIVLQKYETVLMLAPSRLPHGVGQQYFDHAWSCSKCLDLVIHQQ